MKILKMSKPDRDSLYAELAGMTDFLDESFRGLPASRIRESLAADEFSPVEHCWHLADLEREAFAVRIRRLIDEDNPMLGNFDGSRIALERQYKERSLSEGIAAFRESRLRNIEMLKSIPLESWTRKGEQEGVGTVMLCDIPEMMAGHDAEHKRQIAEWLRAIG